MLGDLPDGYDRYIRHLDKDEQKRRVWLGVEYTAPEKEMIKQMNLREPTQDGRIGVVVNRVYPGSPAAAMGLTEGDILLKITVPGTPWPIELAGDDRDSYGVPDFDEADIPKEFAAMGYQMPRRRPWPSQDNYLTRLLGEIGPGATVKLSYIHGTGLLEKEFTIQQAPRDMLSAAKYKNDKLGLTVKDVTYEVRAALRLTPEEPAIVAVKVEQGTPAALARINTYELIRAVDGVSVDNVGTFEKLIAQAQESKKDSVRVTVEWMGKTRLADLKFEAKPPAGMLNSLLRGRQEP
jgi:S1-C subfamily serine protease